MIKMLLITLIAMIFLHRCNGSFLSVVSNVPIFNIDGYYEMTKEVVSKAQFAESRGEDVDLFGNRAEIMLEELLVKVDNVVKKVEEMEVRLLKKLDNMENLIRGISDDVQKKNVFYNMIGIMKSIKDTYDEFQSYAHLKKIPEKPFRKFLERNVNGESDVQEKLKKIHRIIVPNSFTATYETPLLDLIAKTANANRAENCGGNSAQYDMYILFTKIAALEVIGFTITTYSLSILAEKTKNNETDAEIQFISNRMMKRMNEYMTTFAKTIPSVSREFRTCDPIQKHVRDETFTEMWGFTQAVVFYEYDLISSGCTQECSQMKGSRENLDCWYLDAVNNHQKTTYDQGIPRNEIDCPTQRQCSGLIESCQSLWAWDICPLANNTRRYEYVLDKYTDTRYGSSKSCNGNKITGSHVAEKTSIYRCSYCLCMCNEDEGSVHTFSLLPSMSDINNNKVITGVRFQLVDKIIHVQVKQRTILTDYQVSINASWVPLPNIGEAVRKAQLSPRDRWNKLIERRDFVSWYLRNGIDLNDVILPYNRVITGVRFAQAYDFYVYHLQVEVQSTEYNPATGQLNKRSSKWERPTAGHKNRHTLSGTKNPLDATSATAVDSKQGEYLKLRASDLKTDAAQTVLPLFDAQTVESRAPGPLTGLGLHHRSSGDDGGFIAFNAFSVDYGTVMEKMEAHKLATSREDMFGPK